VSKINAAVHCGHLYTIPQKEFEKKKENENALFLEKINKERIRIEAEAQDKIRKQLHADYDNQIKTLQEEKAENEARLKSAREKELEFMRKENELKNKEFGHSTPNYI
jgi:hypothetical protein